MILSVHKKKEKRWGGCGTFTLMWMWGYFDQVSVLTLIDAGLTRAQLEEL